MGFVIISAVLDPDIDIVVFFESGRLYFFKEINRVCVLLEFENYGLFYGTYFLELRGRFVVGLIDFKIVAGFPLGIDVDIDKKNEDENEKCEECTVHFLYILSVEFAKGVMDAMVFSIENIYLLKMKTSFTVVAILCVLIIMSVALSYSYREKFGSAGGGHMVARSGSSASNNSRGGGGNKDKGCFSNDSIIYLENGETKRIEDAEVGDKILSYSSTNEFVYSPIIAIPHPKNNILSEFIVLKTSNDKTIKATYQHLIPIFKDGKIELVEANNIQINDLLVTTDGNETVVSKDTVEKEGIYTVVTLEDYIVVDNVVVSPYAISHLFGNVYYSMFKFMHSINPKIVQSEIIKKIVETNAVGLGIFMDKINLLL